MTQFIPTVFAVVVTILVLPIFCGMAAAEELQFLRARGHDIVDSQGNKVMLRGVGLGNWMLPEGYMWRFGPNGDRPRRIEKIVSDLIGPEQAQHFWRQFRQDYVTEADIARIAELGFNSVRPALNARLFLTEGDNPQRVDEGWQLLDDLIARCKKHKIYVIIDMHAAPGGQTGSNIDDSANDQPELFTSPENQDRLERLWVEIAQKYKDEPTVAGYDLLNEPLPKRTGAFDTHKNELEPTYKRLTAAIRKVDSKHMIIVEGGDWANDWSVFSEPFDPNMAYQFHYYCWDRPDNVNDIGRYLRYREKFNRPIWVGETGEKNAGIYWATTDLFEANNITWSFWTWKKMEANNGVYSYPPPQHWEQVQAYSRGGAAPSREIAQQAFDQLLQSIKLENCTYHEDVVSALFHRVPATLEAENYGHEGAGKSYSLKSDDQKSKYYRKTEPVPIELIEPMPDEAGPTTRRARRWESQQAIKLEPDEWTAYIVNSQRDREYQISIRAEPESGSAELEFSVDGQAQPVLLDQKGWATVPLKPMKLSSGENRIKLMVRKGVARVDWLKFE